MLDVTTILLIIAGLMVVVGLTQPLAMRLRLPSSVLLAAVGVLIGSGAAFLLYTPLTDVFNETVAPIVHLPFRSATFINVFLPLLLFQTSLTIDVRRMAEDAAPILLLAVVAVLVSTAMIGYGLAAVTSFSLTACLLLGSIVATTDPAAVVAIFRDIGAPARLTRLVEGESLLNDAAAIALFTVLLGMLTLGTKPDLTQTALQFGLSFAGGIGLGLVGGRLLVWMLPRLEGLRTAEVTLTLAAPYLIFILGDRYLGVSGVVAVVTAGLVLSAMGRGRVRPENWNYLVGVWEQIAFWASSLVFILASILVPRLLGDISLYDVLPLLVLIAAALAARALVLFLLLPLLSALRLGDRVSWTYKTAILWGGLRGALTLALALAVTENRLVSDGVKEFVAVLATGFVLFTLFVNGTTLRPLIRRLGLDRLSPLELALRQEVLTLALGNVRDAIATTAREYDIAPPVARSVTRPYEARMAEIAAGGSLEETIPDRDRFTVGLIALASRERELVLAHYAEQTISQPIVEILLRDTGAIIDGARAAGRTGYMRAARRALRYRFAFRFAHALQRWLGLTGPLARALEDRFALLLVRRLLVEELRRFNRRRLQPILGERVADLLGDMLEARQAATAKALDALRLQYPEYAEALEQRFLRRVASRQEMIEYGTLLEEGLIHRELYDSLRRDPVSAAASGEGRPRLDLSFKAEELIGRFAIFRDLDAKQLRRVARLMRTRFAVPGEVVLRPAQRERALYFIASGAVEAERDDGPIRLGPGDSFGEVAASRGVFRPKRATALTYSQLLVLRTADLERFLKRNPAMRAHLDTETQVHLEDLAHHQSRS